MSEQFGANEYGKLKKSMASISVFGFYFSALIALLGILFSRLLLRGLNVPHEIEDLSVLYLRLSLIAVPFTFFYNSVSAALKSIGDSKTALNILAFSAVLNAVLEFIFVGLMKFGLVCSALTTVAAEAVSAILCILYVYKSVPLFQLKISEFKIEWHLLKRILQYGSITALQQSCQPIGKLFIQGAINHLGVLSMAAFNAVSRIDDYAFTPQQSISAGMTTFIAQNRGALKYKRIRRGFSKGLLIEIGYWIILCIVILLFRNKIMSLFASKSDSSIITLGSSYLFLMAFFYLLPAFTNGMQGLFRGMGDMKVTVVGTLIQIGFRVLFVYLLTPKIGLNGVVYASVIGWIFMLIFEFSYASHYRRMIAK